MYAYYFVTYNIRPSHCAALKGSIDCLKCLIKYNADIWIKNKRGDYPVHEAVKLHSLRNQISDLSKLQTGCSGMMKYLINFLFQVLLYF